MKKSLLLAATAALLLGAGPALAKKQLVIVVKGLDNPFFEAIHQGCEKWNSENKDSEYECFYTGPASRNPDSHTHARVQADWLPGTTLVSFEDLYTGPFNFNDLSFSFTNTTSGPVSVPEPNPLVLMLAGIGIVGLMARSRRA